jgi:tetratricopeptide (TPR) repeat protein
LNLCASIGKEAGLPMSAPRNLSRILIALALFTSSLHAADQHWIRVSSDHFVVLTDSSEKSGHDVVARFEQMRAVFGQLLMRSKLTMGQPIEIIAVSNQGEYDQIAPMINGKPAPAPGFWLSGEERIFVVLNLSQADNWRPVEQRFAHYLLNYNYPPTPVWFDEGLAEYFASLRLTATKVDLGGDPTPNLRAAVNSGTPPSESFTEILKGSAWIPWTDLLNGSGVAGPQAGERSPLFDAQSWILVHYLLNKDKMSETGVFFNMVENQKAPVDQAVQQAFGMSVSQLDHEIREYFRSLTPRLNVAAAERSAPAAAPISEAPVPFSLEDVGTSSKQVSIPEAQALVNEMELRIPERREAAISDLQKLTDNPKTETVAAHRALAWADVQKGETDHAFEELNDAMKLNPSDPWTRLGLALASYHSGEKGARIQGLANMMESLHIVIDEYPQFAQAYNMLGWARLEGGGPNAAIESLKVAVQLSPRNEQYQLLLAEAYFSGKKFNQATGILDRLKLSENHEVASAANKDLSDLPFIEKYGVPPEQAKAAKQAAQSDSHTDTADDEDDEPSPKPVSSGPIVDKRPVKFLKATLVSVDCSKSPAAILSISQAGRLLKLRAPDYKSIAVIGAPEFSCGWKQIPVNLNYRASSKTTGDLVSIEIPEAGR